MKVVIEEVTEKDYPNPVKKIRKKVEVSLSPLWEDPEMVFSEDNGVPDFDLNSEILKTYNLMKGKK